MSTPKLLFLSPVVPVLSGQGLAMRAGIVLQALAQDYQVFLLVIPINPGPAGGQIPPRILEWCTGVEVLALEGREDPLYLAVKAIVDPEQRAQAWFSYPKPSKCRFATPESLRLTAEAFAGVRFDAVHVFRLYTAPFADSHLHRTPGARPRCFLDMDDYQSQVRRKVSALHAGAGDQEKTALEESDARKYVDMERAYLPLFDQVLVSNPCDAAAISRQYDLDNVSVLPNAVRLPQPPAAGQAAENPTLLFLGTLDYFPNEDAAIYLCHEILPLLRARAAGRFRIVIAGLRPSARVRGLSVHPEVTVAADVPEVGRYYEEADMVVVPLRLGGGTRIKILEAASYQRPVVSTPAGADGLAVTDGKEILIRRSAPEFAEACLLLMNDALLRKEIAGRAFEWVKANHTVEAVRQRLRRCCRLPA
jgi:glycosyltransferase involved in cell wall biosynthesis